MKALIVLTHLPLETEKIKGGVHSAVMNLLQGFSMIPVNIRVLSFSNEINQTKKITFTDNIELHFEPEGKLPFHSLNYLLYGPGLLKKHVKDFKPDIVHYQSGNTLLFSSLKSLSGIPCVLTAHAFAWEEMKTKKSLREKITWWYNGLIHQLLSPENIIFISEQSYKKNRHKKIKRDTIIPNAINSAFFKIPGKPNFDNQLLYVGIINNRKNLLQLLTSMQHLNQCGMRYTLNVVGDFGDEAYKKLILDYINDNQLGHQVHLLGWKSQPEIIEILQRSDLLVLPSLQETLPMVIAEAMAAGKPVVASNVGGIPEMIEHGKTGYLFDIQHPETLDDVLKILYNNQQAAHQTGKMAKEKIEANQSAKAVAEKTASFYQYIIQTNNK